MDLYKVANKWLGVLPGGLAIGTIAGFTGFGVVSGSAVAAVGLMTETTLPSYDTDILQGLLQVV